MYFAFKYAKKKYIERKQANTTETSVLKTAEVSPSHVEPASLGDSVPCDQIETVVPPGNNTGPTDEEKGQPLVVEKAASDVLEKKRRRKYGLKIIFGLLAPFALQSLDTTIIASALPFIAKDFGKKIHKDLTKYSC
jgi:hypothetical protein